jgi:hypothetical protein
MNIALQIVKALKYAFEKYHIVHLDLKLQMYDSFKETNIDTVSDWGISRIASQIAQANCRRGVRKSINSVWCRDTLYCRLKDFREVGK